MRITARATSDCNEASAARSNLTPLTQSTIPDSADGDRREGIQRMAAIPDRAIDTKEGRHDVTRTATNRVGVPNVALDAAFAS
jgi:hypothetical protein